ncbi:hypothetical protein JXA32_02105 [Candidatus Sumerlaeota bacterium]|nr:hypothetical protein [Candidatus Sumerlaeota bacterium]
MTVEKPHAPFIQHAVDLEVSDALLQRHAPCFVLHDDGRHGPILNPSDFVAGGSIQEVGAELDPETLDQWLSEPSHSELSHTYHLQPQKSIYKMSPKKIAQANKQAFADGKGVFGIVRRIDENVYSVKYFFFLAISRTFLPLGSHEGDWLCIDLQVESDDPLNRSDIVYAIDHYHGKQFIANRDGGGAYPGGEWTVEGRLRFADDDSAGQHPIAYLEEGANELHTCPGVYRDGPMRLQHQGRGSSYRTASHVQNLDDASNLECRLIMRYRGHWGATAKGGGIFKPITGNVTNPKAPPFQGKMWDRSFAANPFDPISDMHLPAQDME